MQNRSCYCLALLGGLLFAAGAADARPTAPITDVLLYPGGATIVRTVQVAPGMKQAVIAGLPSDFDVRSLHAEASNGIRIGEIASADAAATHAANPAEAALEAKITALHDREAALDAEAKSAQMAVDYLGRLVASDGKSGDSADAHRPRPMLDAKTLTGLVNAMRSEAAVSLRKLQALAVQKREIGKNIAALQRDLERLRSGGTDTRTLTISLEAARAGTLNVSYQVNNAGWKPAYRATLNSETSRVQLERRAIISQKTGEDWSNVHLTLSTTQPRHATSGADPQPWLLSYIVQLARERFMSGAAAPANVPMSAPVPEMAAKQKLAYADMTQANEDKDAYSPPTFETRSMFSNEYEVPARTSLPADGREVSVELTRQEIAVKQYFQATPRLEAAAYVTVEADMPEGDWPAGNIQLFRNNRYVGNSNWYPQEKDKFVLGFGRDDQVQVSVVPVKADSSSSGIIAKHSQKKIATVFSIVNRHQLPIVLKVLEAAPVATSDEIKVHTAFAPKPSRENWEDKRGVRAWERSLAHKAGAKI